MVRTCCVVNCKNNDKNKKCHFYLFPTSTHKLKQRNKWIAAVKRVNCDGTPWFPKKFDFICSEHFVGHKKSDEELSPSFVPSIFPDIYKAKKVSASTVNRFSRFMNKIKLKQAIKINTVKEKCKADDEKGMEQNNIDIVNIGDSNRDEENKKKDKECQVELYNKVILDKTFICNIVMYNNRLNVEIQTEIPEKSKIIITPSQKVVKDKQCNTEVKKFADLSVGVNLYENNINSRAPFMGFSSLKNEQQFLDLLGVSSETFQFFLKQLNAPPNHSKVSKEDKLLIFLFKMKSGLPFSAISVLFNVNRSTISRIFFSVLDCLAAATSNLVYWPEKDIVQATIPNCFYPHFSNTRVIIDCTEFRIEVPSGVDNTIYTYSHYKKGFTAKLLIGITPSGFISFKSKVAGGRKSDSQLVIQSGLIDLLESGDVVLADKGFPEIHKSIDKSGKEVTVIMPPFLEKKSEFTKEETEETYAIARVRIHVERIMQRLRIYKIFCMIPENLFNSIDKIVHMGCALVNLQPPIISMNEEVESNN